MCALRNFYRFRRNFDMKQQKGRDYKPTRQWTADDRVAKKGLRENMKKSLAKGDLDEDKIIPQTGIKGEVQ